MTHSYFSALHAMPNSQIFGEPCAVPDTPETAAARADDSEQGLRALAAALDYQLRYREALGVYDRLLTLCPEDAVLRRRRATRRINTLQPDRAIADLLACRAMGMPDEDVSYPLGIACYLARRYADAMTEMARVHAFSDDEMGIAAIYWHTLAAYRCEQPPALLAAYHPGMAVGHHTAYEHAAALLSGQLSEAEYNALLEAEPSDLEYAMLAYAGADLLRRRGRTGEYRALLRSIRERDSFWIGYAWLAALRDN